jgi:hypothetical protein
MNRRTNMRLLRSLGGRARDVGSYRDYARQEAALFGREQKFRLLMNRIEDEDKDDAAGFVQQQKSASLRRRLLGRGIIGALRDPAVGGLELERLFDGG